MRAAVLSEYGSIDNLSLTEFDDPVAGPEDLIIGVRATAVNYVDLVMVSGTYQFRPSVIMQTTLKKDRLLAQPH